MIRAEIIADSTARNGKRIVTFVLEYPRFIHSELMTHRVFSKNSASSRAIPIERMIDKVVSSPAIPSHWSKNQKGMTQVAEIEDKDKALALWLKARDEAVKKAKQLSKLGLHKAVVNRILEPFMHMKVILTGTEFDNFFKLRCHPDAQPEIQELATKMRDAMSSSVSKQEDSTAFSWDKWHLPFVTQEELSDISDSNRFRNLVRSVARCARVSYDRVEGGASDFENDLRIFKQLCGDVPHFSPFEHQAYPTLDAGSYFNLNGWRSLRYDLERDKSYFQKIIDAC